LLESPAINKHCGRLRLPLGKDIAGDVKVVEFDTDAPFAHCRCYRFRKTVFVKALLQVFYSNIPLMSCDSSFIDPKMVEFLYIQ
jgi:hypothetical protein